MKPFEKVKLKSSKKGGKESFTNSRSFASMNTEKKSFSKTRSKFADSNNFQ